MTIAAKSVDSDMIAPRIAVAMLGARRHYAVPRLLHEAGMLEVLFTDSYIGNKPGLEAALRLIPPQIRPQGFQRWLGRKDSFLPPDKVRSFEFLGLWYSWARRRAQGATEASAVFRDCAIRFNQRIEKAGLGAASIVWGYNGAALEIFQVASREGRRCVLDQTILPRAIERRLITEEQLRFPDWERRFEYQEASLPTDGREEAEWTIADLIVTGSDFVRDGLVSLGVAPEKVRVIPYGVDPLRFMPNQGNRASILKNRPLRILFAGAVGLRKGVPDLLEALRQFKPGEIEAKFVGEIELHDEKLKPYRAWAEFLGPVPRSQMVGLYRWADVFVLPSIVEGSATVTYEAMMSGCPVITTPNAGSMVRDGIDGFVVPIHAPDKLAEALRRCIQKPELLLAHRERMLDTSARLGLLRYKEDIVKVVSSLVSPGGLKVN